MSPADAEHLVGSLRRKSSRRWKSPKHVATTTWREQAIRQLLTGDHEPGTRTIDANRDPVLVELFLHDTHPQINEFAGISRVDSHGIWFYDGDGDIDDTLWREYLIPWHLVASVRIHQAS